MTKTAKIHGDTWRYMQVYAPEYSFFFSLMRDVIRYLYFILVMLHNKKKKNRANNNKKYIN